jgi:hypothetical protein
MTPFCLVVSGGSQIKDNDDALLDIVLMSNAGPLGAKMCMKQRFYLDFM